MKIFFFRVISVISVVLRETTLTISDSTGETVAMESEIARAFQISTTEISQLTRLKIQSSGEEYLNEENFIQPNSVLKVRHFFFFLRLDYSRRRYGPKIRLRFLCSPILTHTVRKLSP